MSGLTARAGAILVLACAGVASAQSLQQSSSSSSPSSTDSFTLQRPLYAQATAPSAAEATATEPSTAPTTEPAPPPPKPLMALLGAVGVGKALDDAHINIGGLIETSWTYNFDPPANGVNVGRVFDFENEDPTLNQLQLFVEKKVDPTKGFDIGGRMEWLYGADARLIHSNGLFDHYGVNDGPENQFDLTQLYIDVGIPVGNGLTVRAGKFITLIGQEYINPSQNALFSHSYLFGFAIPFTHTGILGIYPINDKITITGGITRGWEQSLEDNNGSVDGIGQVAWTVNDKLSVTFSFITGPEEPAGNNNWRTLLDLIVAYKLTDQLTLTANGDYGWEPGAAADGSGAVWYGIAGYAGYTLNDYLTLNGRIEWFNDDDGARGLGTTVYEATVGVAVHPMPSNSIGSNLVVRPEVRYDYGEDAIFDGGTKHDQWTFGVDAIFTF